MDKANKIGEIMKQLFKYLNDNRQKCVLGVNDFLPENIKIVKPCEVVTFELDISDEDVIFIKTWKQDNKILVSKVKKSVWSLSEE